MYDAINYDNLRSFGYSNDKICNQPIRGIIIDFFGLGGQSMYAVDTPFGRELADRGIILLIPYINPWAWMNMPTVKLTDRLVEALLEKYHLPQTTPIVSSGGSMGGLCALVYTRYARLLPVACVANCPVCDLPYHYTEREDLPRTIFSAFSQSGYATLAEAMESASPLHLAGSMPDTDYFLFHCDGDSAVNIQMHSDRFYHAMESTHKIVYHVVPEREHCDLGSDMASQYHDYMIHSILK